MGGFIGFRNSWLLCLVVWSMIGCEDEPILNYTSHDLPVVSVSINEKYLWSPDSGLFVKGTNGIANWRGEIANYHQNWEFPCSITFMESGDTLFTHPVGFRIKGNSSVKQPNKSMGLYWRQEYGPKNLKIPVFPDQEVEKVERLKLRNGGSDGSDVLIRDLAISRLIKGTHVTVASGQPVVVYINNEYWGLYNLREIIHPDYLAQIFNTDEAIDILQYFPSDPGIDDGFRDEFVNEVVHFLENNDLSIEANYSYIQTKLDLESLIDYHIIETYIYNWDWPVNNMKWWHSRVDSSHRKWKWIVFDVDQGFQISHVKDLWLGDFFRNSNSARLEYEDGFLLFNHLMKNKNFQVLFFERYLEMIDTVFDPVRTEQIISSLVSEIGPEYSRHADRWDYPDPQEWRRRLDNLISFNINRTKWLRPKISQWLDEARAE